MTEFIERLGVTYTLLFGAIVVGIILYLILQKKSSSKDDSDDR